METMNRWAFDVEVFPNFFCCTFMRIDRSETKTFIIFEGKNEAKEMGEFLKSPGLFLVSFNGISYDLPVIRYVISYDGFNANKDIYTLSTKLVSDFSKDDPLVRKLRYPYEKGSWIHQDLMSMMGFLKTGVGLKQCSVNLKWKRVQDLPFHYDYVVKPEDTESIVNYNKNDVLITIELYNDEEVYKIRTLRESVAEIYGDSILSASDSAMANTILETLYEKETNISKKVFKEGRTPRYKVFLSDVIFDRVSFKTVELQEFLDQLSTRVLTAINDFKFSESLYFYGNKFNFGIGGLHTDEPPSHHIPGDGRKILSADVASFYPSIMCNYEVKPAHLNNKFLPIMRTVRKERLEAKKAGDKTKDGSYKIVINSTFGKLGFKEYWLYDPLAMLKVTVNGQLFLMMLVERLEIAGIKVISANTDGIEVILNKEMEPAFYEIAKQWEKDTTFELEYAEYKIYIKRDVNNYIALCSDGKVKEKGIFVRKIDLKKSYHMPIVAKALYSYFISGITVRETLNGCRDIMEFCISQKSGSDFEIELHTINGIKKLQKTNRFFISRKGGTLIKRGGVKKTIGLYVGSNVTVLNTFDPNVPFEEYDVNLAFYEREVMKIIDLIEPKQDSLFDLGTLDNGVKTKNTFKPVIREELPKAITVKSLNKLPRDEMMDSLKDIVSKNECLNGISPRYVYVLSFNTKSLMAEVYCLAKGVIQELEVDKSAYKKSKMEAGQLVLCTRFSKYNGLHIIAEYKITDKIEEDNKTLI